MAHSAVILWSGLPDFFILHNHLVHIPSGGHDFAAERIAVLFTVVNLQDQVRDSTRPLPGPTVAQVS